MEASSVVNWEHPIGTLARASKLTSRAPYAIVL